MFKIRFSRFSKYLKTTWNSPVHAICWINSKSKQHSKKYHTHNILNLSLLLVIIMVSLSDPHLRGKKCFICFNKSPLKMMKNAFYFILKALLGLEVFKFWCWVFGHLKNSIVWLPLLRVILPSMCNATVS